MQGRSRRVIVIPSITSIGAVLENSNVGESSQASAHRIVKMVSLNLSDNGFYLIQKNV